MKRTDFPVNISILQVTPHDLQAMRPVTALDIFDGATDNLHPNGLFSIEIFGRPGSDDRDRRFSFIDLKVDIIHPFIYKQIVLLKALYGGILSGKAYALWDDKQKDFVASDPIHGKTGFSFFLAHFNDIEIKRTGSDIRDFRIKAIDKYRNAMLLSKVLVMPAGLRDVEVSDGRVKQGEINDHYRSLISISNTISTMGSKNNAVLDQARYSMQMAFIRVYDYIHDLLDGKSGFMQAKWGARRIYNGTRNVIVAMDTSAEHLESPNSPDINSTVVGLFQTLKGVLPVAKHLILNGWMSTVFNRQAGTAYLVNPTTLKRELVVLDPQIIDKWTTTSGIESVINGAQSLTKRLKPIKLKNYYVGLVYTSEDHRLWKQPVFKFFADIDEVPLDRGISRKDVRPITLYELLYVAGYKRWNDFPIFVTRYPVTGIESIYASKAYVMTTTKGVCRVELNEEWDIPENAPLALEYPDVNIPSFIDTMAPHVSRLAGMGADQRIA